MNAEEKNAQPDKATRWYRQSQMTPAGRWVTRFVTEWEDDEVANEGRSIAENDAIQQERAE